MSDVYAAMDLELNTESSNKREYFDLIEVGLVIYENGTFNILEKYQSYVKTKKAPIFERITELTGITQDIIDEKGKDFLTVYAEMVDIVKKYKVKKIYTWGDYDEVALGKNCKMYPIVPDKHTILRKIEDYAAIMEKLLRIRGLSLEEAVYIYNADKDDISRHHALDDAMLVYYIAKALNDGCDGKRVERVRNFIKIRDMYNSLRGKFRQNKEITEKSNLSAEKLWDMINRDEDFFDFENFIRNCE
ncbi:MAG: hypothetical protein IJ583_14900 [Firmicutes bacterium]|nr:hypothetical protein [Bacillota bacterium]